MTAGAFLPRVPGGNSESAAEEGVEEARRSQGSCLSPGWMRTISAGREKQVGYDPANFARR